MYEGRYAYCSVIVDKRFSSTICISKSVFIFKCFFQSVFIPKCIYPKCISAKCTRLACLLSFASLFNKGKDTKSKTKTKTKKRGTLFQCFCQCQFLVALKMSASMRTGAGRRLEKSNQEIYLTFYCSATQFKQQTFICSPNSFVKEKIACLRWKEITFLHCYKI